MRLALDDRVQWEGDPELALSESKWWKEYTAKRMDGCWRTTPEFERLCAVIWAYRKVLGYE